MLTPMTTIKVAAVSSVNSHSIAFHRHPVWPDVAAALSYALAETFGRVNSVCAARMRKSVIVITAAPSTKPPPNGRIGEGKG